MSETIEKPDKIEVRTGQKVQVAIFDKDLVVRKLGKYPLSARGTKIEITKGGEGHFMPDLDRNTLLMMPRRSLLPPFRLHYEPWYFVLNGAKKCVDFNTENISDIDVQGIKDAAKKVMVDRLNQQKDEGLKTLIYIVIVEGLILILNAMGVFV